jgi:D-alanine-D-alanine ligase
MDKVMTKRIWRFEGLPTPPGRRYTVVPKPVPLLPPWAPVIVKPAREGSSIGFTKVLSAISAWPPTPPAALHDPMVLCEQFIAGDEVTCPVLGA